MFQPKFVLQQPDGLPSQLWLKDETGLYSARNTEGWTAEALADALLNITIRDARTGASMGGTYSLAASTVFDNDHALPFAYPDGVYDLEVYISSTTTPVTLNTYSLTSLLLDPNHYLQVGRGASLTRGSLVNVTNAVVRTGGYVNWSSGAIPDEYTFWLITDNRGEIIQSGLFDEQPGSVVPAPPSFGGSWNYRFLIDRHLRAEISHLADHLPIQFEDGMVARPAELEALNAWGLLYFLHDRLNRRMTSYSMAEIDNQLTRIARLSARIRRIIARPLF